MKENAASAGVQPYLFFGGRCQEALDFYASAAGATVEMLMRFDESPDPALAEGGQVQMPLGPTFWSPRYGQLTDRFGVAWMVMVPPEQGDPLEIQPATTEKAN